MQLIQIDKARYRKHLNIVIMICIVLLTSGCLGISQTIIQFFPDPSGSHFHWNLTGVIITSIMIGIGLVKIRHHAFMTEVVYVWDLKQALNRVTRSMKKVKAAAELGNYDALLALQFNYAGSRLLWELDDNTIIMDELAVEQAKLDALLTQYNISVNVADYSRDTLDKIPE